MRSPVSVRAAEEPESLRGAHCHGIKLGMNISRVVSFLGATLRSSSFSCAANIRPCSILINLDLRVVGPEVAFVHRFAAFGQSPPNWCAAYGTPCRSQWCRPHSACPRCGTVRNR